MIANLFTPTAHYDQQWTGSVAIVSPGHIPTVDFYITSRLSGTNPSFIFRFETFDVDFSATALPVGTFVIIVRHTSSAWISFIEANRHRWSGVAYLMDDDLPKAMLCRDIPLDYALWTGARYLKARKGLARICDRVWLSTEALRARYSRVPSRLVSPQQFSQKRDAAPVGVKRWAYHGTRTHKKEMKWLLPIVNAVQNTLPEAEFEIFGDKTVERLFRGVPRVSVIPAMPWSDYLKYCDTASIAVGLAPMLAGEFNGARSYTKAFDIARCGAVGVFSRSTPYAALEACTGASVLPNNQAQWVAEVIALLQDGTLRLQKYKQFSTWVEHVSARQEISTVITNSAVGV